ncbi:hypothetical protein SALBM311S_03424 [Streptomyces alboniger]
MKVHDFFGLLHGITNTEPCLRARGADEVMDLLSSYSREEAAALATTLAATAACEENREALESQLHAILELTSTGHIKVDHIARLREIELNYLSKEIRGYITDLLED